MAACAAVGSSRYRDTLATYLPPPTSRRKEMRRFLPSTKPGVFTPQLTDESLSTGRFRTDPGRLMRKYHSHTLLYLHETIALGSGSSDRFIDEFTGTYQPMMHEV